MQKIGLCLDFEHLSDDDWILIEEKVGDYYTQNIFEYREYLLKSDREKDIRRLALVEDYIKNNN